MLWEENETQPSASCPILGMAIHRIRAAVRSPRHGRRHRLPGGRVRRTALDSGGEAAHSQQPRRWNANLVNALAKQSHRPQVLVCASAIGYYGSRGDEVLTETSAPGSDFLAQVVIDWEQAARQAEALGIRVVPLRFGVVLGKDGGALAKMLPPFRLGLGGRLASGQQWMSWIHVDDVIGLIRFSLDNSAVRGPDERHLARILSPTPSLPRSSPPRCIVPRSSRYRNSPSKSCSARWPKSFWAASGCCPKQPNRRVFSSNTRN